MAIHFMVERPKNEKYVGETIPIGSLDTFRRFWLPGALEIEAHWLPLFETGVSVPGEKFDEVSRELVTFRKWVQCQAYPDNLKGNITTRTDLLLDSLARLYVETKGDIVAYIG
jgi:hypothetical protein